MDPGRLVITSIERVARNFPSSTAVVDIDGRSVSFAELMAEAEHWASQLAIAPGEMVGLSMPRGARLIAAMIGIVKAGGVYVPFAGDEPPDRLAALQARLGLRYWVGQSVQRLGDGPAPVVGPLEAGGDPPLYVMWTSGSTGLPKAVVVPHGGVIRLAGDRTITDFRPDDRMCFASNPAFDATTWEVWAALSNGVPVVVIPHDELVDASRLRARFEAQGVTLAFLTTALFDHLARTDPGMFGCLRTLAVGGEQMRPATVRAVLQSRTPPQRLVNAYGPTEATTFSAAHVVGSVAADATLVPIGEPLAQTELVVVDHHGEPVQGRETGELWIAGTGVALGYLHDEEATDRAFVTRSFEGFGGQRWYRTGDLARRDDHGRLECLGRIDRQLKINGHRIEPAEIEHTMLGIAGVRAAAAVARPRGNGAQVVAFAVTDGTIAAPQIIQRLRDELPGFLVPAQVHVVDGLPVTSNGKLDEAALLETLRPSPAAAPLRDPLVAHILAQACEILGDDGLQATDELLAAGFDSLSAVELSCRMGAAGLPAPPPSALLHHRSALELARWVRDGWQQRVSTVVRVGDPLLPPLFFVPGGGSTALFIADFGATLRERLRVVTVEPRGLHTAQARDRTVGQMAARVIQAISDEQPTGVVRLCGHSSGGVIAHEAARQLVRQGRTVRVLLLDSRFLGNEGAAGLRWLRIAADATTRRLRRIVRRGGRTPAPPVAAPAVAVSTGSSPDYLGFMTTASRAVRAHRAKPAGADIRCVHATDFTGCCGGRVSHVAHGCVTVEGDHRTLVRTPHVQSWAHQAADWLLDAP